MASSEVGGDTRGGEGFEASQSSVMGDINVTPMVDVMLVLLIIFMIVTPAILAGFQARMPEGAHLKARPEKDERTMFGIDRDGNWFLNKKTDSQGRRAEAPRTGVPEASRRQGDVHQGGPESQIR